MYKEKNSSQKILKKLRSLANPKNVEGMARFGIPSKNALGISIPVLRKMARETGKNHDLAQALWDSGIHEARIFASFIDEPVLVSEEQMECWVKDFDSWDVCDQVCGNLFDKTPFAYKKCFEWSKRNEEFVKRAGFSLMACLAVHDKMADDSKFAEFFPVIVSESTDERNFVKKAVNWALRQIGKRNSNLRKNAIETAKCLASDALRELEKRLKVKPSF